MSTTRHGSVRYAHCMDALSAVLGRVDLQGAVLSRADMKSPWGVRSGCVEGSVFHAVLVGHAVIEVDGAPPMSLDAGDVAFLAQGAPHILKDAPRRRAVPLEQFAASRHEGVVVVTGGGEGALTSILCGRVQLPQGGVHTLFSSVPPLLVARRPPGARGAHVDAALRWILDEVAADAPGSDAIAQRLVEVFVLRLLQSAVKDGLLDGHGWLGGLKDPVVARALAFLHRQDGAPSARGLADAVGVSRSVLYARFAALVGESPAKYAVRWRMHQAARKLANEGCTVSEAAERAGYATEAAFAKAFKRVVGKSPGSLRVRPAA